MTAYKWTRRFPVDAQIVGEVIEALPERSADYLLREARKKRSPVHSLFEWDNTKAAREYRLLQARLIINSLECEVVSVGSEPQYIKAYIKQAGDTSIYVEIDEATDDDVTDAEAECIRHMERFKKRWSDLALAKSVIAEINAARISAAKKRRRKKAA